MMFAHAIFRYDAYPKGRTKRLVSTLQPHFRSPSQGSKRPDLAMVPEEPWNFFGWRKFLT